MAAVTSQKIGDTYVYTWNLTTADPTGDAINLSGAPDKTIQLLADTAGTATAKLQGSNTNVDADFLSLTDPQGNEISKTDDAIEAVTENPAYIRPKLTTPGTAAVWRAILVARSGK